MFTYAHTNRLTFVVDAPYHLFAALRLCIHAFLLEANVSHAWGPRLALSQTGRSVAQASESVFVTEKAENDSNVQLVLFYLHLSHIKFG